MIERVASAKAASIVAPSPLSDDWIVDALKEGGFDYTDRRDHDGPSGLSADDIWSSASSR